MSLYFGINMTKSNKILRGIIIENNISKNF